MSDEKRDQRTLALWAADCAERVLSIYEAKYPDDDRPRKAIEAARAWARGDIRAGQARAAALATHAAAREATDPAAIAAARAAGHAAATAHVATHCSAAGLYAIKAASAAAEEAERAWQRERLPERLWPAEFPQRWHADAAL